MSLASPDLDEKIVPPGTDPAPFLTKLARPIVFTNGVFDILHRGHVVYLHEARKLGASLVLGLNSDTSVKMLGKGPDRPLIGEVDRAFVLAGLASIDVVIFFSERTPVELIARVRPDLYVKGGDYDMAKLEETRLVESWGGRSLAIPFVAGYSTTGLVGRIKGQA